MHNTIHKVLSSTLVVVLLLCSFVISTGTVAAAGTSVSISPDTQTVSPGSSFTVDIAIDTDQTTRATRFDVAFDPSLVELNSISEGTFYSDWIAANGAVGDSTYLANGIIDNTAGTLTSCGVTLLSTATGGASGTGTVITLNMTAKTSVSGTSALALTSKVWDETVTLIPGVTANNGQVILGSAGTPPDVTTGSASAIGDETVTLNGTLNDMGTASSVDVSFEWGTSIAYGNETTVEAMTFAGAFDAAITGLNPGTTYHFRTKAIGEGTTYGNDVVFITTGDAPSELNLTATILPAVAIMVDPTGIDFGELVAGDVSADHPITITNIGGKSADVTAEVTGDALYDNGMWLDSGLWDVFLQTIVKGDNYIAQASLHVPSDYSSLGTRDGNLIFWATVTP
jgi:hypothetical protein